MQSFVNYNILLQGVGNDQEWMHFATNNRKQWGGILRCCKQQVESLNELQVWLRWDKNSRRFVDPIRATSKGIKSIAKSWKVAIIKSRSFSMVPFSTCFPCPFRLIYKQDSKSIIKEQPLPSSLALCMNFHLLLK